MAGDGTSVHGVGIDTASIDRGASKDFRAHRVLAGASVAIFENLDALECAAARGVFLGLPMKIAVAAAGRRGAVVLLP